MHNKTAEARRMPRFAEHRIFEPNSFMSRKRRWQWTVAMDQKKLSGTLRSQRLCGSMRSSAWSDRAGPSHRRKHEDTKIRSSHEDITRRIAYPSQIAVIPIGVHESDFIVPSSGDCEAGEPDPYRPFPKCDVRWVYNAMLRGTFVGSSCPSCFNRDVCDG